MTLPRFAVDDSWRPRSATILITSYNYAQYVAQAIESGLAQTHPTQVIVVEDGSTDGSRAVVEQYAGRIDAVFQANAGQGAAINAGLPRATGDIVICLDSDDMLAPTLVERLLADWQPGVVMCQYPLTIVDEHGTPEGINPDPPDILAHGDVRPQLLRSGVFGVNVTSGLAFRRSILQSVMPLPVGATRTCPDGYLVRAMAFQGLVQRFEQPLGSYRRHASNDSNVCAAPGGLAEGFRKKIGFAERELEFTRQFAVRHGLGTAPDLGAADPDYVGYRLFNRLVDPTYTTPESTWRLLGRYLRTRWVSPWSLKRRLLAITLAAAAVVSPTPTAVRLLTWLHDPGSRPQWWRKRNAGRWSAADQEPEPLGGRYDR